MDHTTCSNCNLPGKTATVRCLDCEEFYCPTFHASHNSFKAMKDHKVVNIEDLRAGKIVLPVTSSKGRKCEDHDDETKKFYCQTCRMTICRDCIILNHRDHQYVSLKEASKKEVSKLKDLAKESQDLKDKCRDAIRKTEDVGKTLADASKEVRRSLQRVKNEYQKQLDAIFKKHEAELESLEVRRVEELDRIKGALQTTLAKVENACDLTGKTTEIGSDYDIISMYPTLSASLEELNRKTSVVPASPALGYIGLREPRKVEILDALTIVEGIDTVRDEWTKVEQFDTDKLGPYAFAVQAD